MIRAFCSEVGVIGLSKVADPQVHWIRRIIWIILLLFGLFWTIYLVIQRMQYYMSDPKSINVEVINNKQLEFPSLSVCSVRLFGRNWLKSKRPDLPQQHQRFLNVVFNYRMNDSLRNIKNPLSPQEQMKFYDETAQSLISECYLGYDNCSEDFLSVTGTDHFQCMMTRGRYVVTNEWSHQSIVLTLNIDHSDVFQPPRHDMYISKGFALIIQESPEEIFSVMKQSIKLPVNNEVKISLEKSTSTLLSTDTRPCRQTGESKTFCLDKCLADALLENCGCSFMDVSNVSTYCKTAYDWRCNIETAKSFDANETLPESCGCPESCTTIKYNPMVSYSPLVDEAMSNSSDITVVKLYYSSLSIEKTSQQLSYGFWSMMSDIGGALGLFLGSALYTLVEVLDFILTAFIKKHDMSWKSIQTM